MLNQHTLHLLTHLKLDGMARALEEQASQTSAASLSFEERFGLLVDREFTHRDTKRVDRLLNLKTAITPCRSASKEVIFVAQAS